MTLRKRKCLDKRRDGCADKHKRSEQRVDDRGVTGWKMVVALVILAATAVVTLLISGSVEATTAFVVLLLLPLGVYATR